MRFLLHYNALTAALMLLHIFFSSYPGKQPSVISNKDNRVEEAFQPSESLQMIHPWVASLKVKQQKFILIITTYNMKIVMYNIQKYQMNEN